MAKSASPESSRRARGWRVGIEGSRLSIDLSNWKLLLSLGFLILLAWWWLIYLPGTPSYAIWSFDSNLRNRNGAAAAQFIDFQKTARNVMSREIDRTATAKSSGDKPGALLGEAIGKGLFDLLSGPLAQAAKVRFERKVEKSHGAGLDVVEMLDALVNLRRRADNTAVTRVYDKHGKAIDVTLTRENGRWRITDLSGPAIREQFRNLREKAGHPTPGPSPSGPDQSHRQPSV